MQNQEKYLNTTHYFDPVSFSRAQADAAVADFNTEIFEPDAFLGTVRRVRRCQEEHQPQPGSDRLGECWSCPSSTFASSTGPASKRPFPRLCPC